LQYVEVKISADKAYCLPIGDIHWGDKAFKKSGGFEKLKKNLEWLEEHQDHAFGVLMGDIYNVAGRDTKTNPFDSSSDEYDEAAEFFKAYGHLFKGAIAGNHEQRIRNAYGLDPLKQFCAIAKIPYLGTSALIRIQVGARPAAPSAASWFWQNYYMAIHHTTGGGGTLGNALNAVAKLENVIVGCDVYAGGHNHQLVSGTRLKFVPTPGGIARRKIHYVSCGAYLGYEDSYAEEKMFPPGKLGSPRIRFSGLRDKHDVHVSL